MSNSPPNELVQEMVVTFAKQGKRIKSDTASPVGGGGEKHSFPAAAACRRARGEECHFVKSPTKKGKPIKQCDMCIRGVRDSRTGGTRREAVSSRGDEPAPASAPSIEKL